MSIQDLLPAVDLFNTEGDVISRIEGVLHELNEMGYKIEYAFMIGDAEIDKMTSVSAIKTYLD
jgi:hypothetical protein